MATWIFHLRVAQKIAENFKFDIDETAYYIGAIAPDSGQMIDNFTYVPTKDVSHWKREGVSYEQRFEDNTEFYKKYGENETDITRKSFYLGYYIHILTDTIYVRDIIYPYMDLKGRPFWKENITGIRAGWYEIDYRFLAANKDFYPFELLKKVKTFPNTYLDYFAYDDIIERVKFAVELYTRATVHPDLEFFTHTPEKAEEMAVYMTETITELLKKKNYI